MSHSSMYKGSDIDKEEIGDEEFYEAIVVYAKFWDCIGVIDGKRIPVIVRGRDVGSYRNRHEKISQNVLAACNFDLEFMYVLSGWEGPAHDTKLLNDAITRRNGLKVAQECHSDEFLIELMDETSSSTLSVNEDHNFESIIQTQEQEREDANAWKIMDMWMNAILEDMIL
ncbi:uncharacterized protein LOC113859635 [Abrus precatorius]|uniref:Uncharacterized protein LOC113859635 n=1 Tax=Abrus precatorius TaxID=3816 RepID=A0A8B8KW80_ABRPR|nr:uncharacterized protein LOC113859635 [Abrus precatorius]